MGMWVDGWREKMETGSLWSNAVWWESQLSVTMKVEETFKDMSKRFLNKDGKKLGRNFSH
jgi:hypothetical protein